MKKSHLTPRELHAARYVIARVRAEVAPELVQASLFGSRARGDAKADSDVDLLLVFRHLPPDREPFATQTETIAAREAARRGVPVTVWAVSLIDLVAGHRTPMLVDALADSVPLWCSGPPISHVPLTPRDSIACVRALLRRTTEGSHEVAAHLHYGDPPSAARRIRDDIVRLCTAASLLIGITRPRRAEAVRTFIEREDPPPQVRAVLAWVELSYGPGGKEEEAPVAPPTEGLGVAAGVVEALRRGVARRARRLRARADHAVSPEFWPASGEWSLRSQVVPPVP